MSDDQMSNEQAPDGAATGATGAATGGAEGETMSRAEAKKLIEQRQALKAEREQLLARIAQLESAKLEGVKLEGVKPDKIGAPSDDGTPAWARTLAEQVAQLKTEFGDHRTATARTAVEAKVLAEVPDGNRATAKALLGVLGVDFTTPSAAADALALLREQHPTVMVDHSGGTQPRAPARRPDGTIEATYFDQFRTFAEVPDAAKSAAMKDPKVFERLTGARGGPPGGVNI